MPSKKKGRKMCCKRNTYISKKSTYRRKTYWDYKNNIVNRKPKDPNQLIYNYKSRESWKVVPKDSLEVHKDRRKRQTDDERSKDEDENDENDLDKSKHDSYDRCSRQRVPRRRKKYTYRRPLRDCDASSSSSTMSCCTSCAYYMDHE